MPADAYHRVDDPRLPGMRAYDTEVDALGVRRRAIVTHSPTLHAAQSRGFDQTLDKARDRLGALQVRLARGRTRRDRAAVEREIEQICAPRWVAEVLTVTLTGDRARAACGCGTAPTATPGRQLEDRIFGKRILFTNRTDWPVARVDRRLPIPVRIESGFRQLKDPQVISFSPMHHWTDQKIRVHVFYSVLALTVAHLMRREAADAGLHLSVRELLAELAGIEETVLLYHDGSKGRPRAQRMLTDRATPPNNWPGCSASTATPPPDDRATVR